MLTLRSRGALERLYAREQFSAREISLLVGASRSGVLKALDRFSIPREKDRPARSGHLPFGFDYISHQLGGDERLVESAGNRAQGQPSSVSAN